MTAGSNTGGGHLSASPLSDGVPRRLDSVPTDFEGLGPIPNGPAATRALAARVLGLSERHQLPEACLVEMLDVVEQAIRATPAGNAAPPPAVVDRPTYEMRELLGRGGVGEVWRVRDPSLGRVLAMKVLRRELADRLGDAFLDEARLIASLDHPTVVPVYGFGHLPPPDGRPFFTMREVPGRTFGAHIDEAHRAGPPVGGRLLSPIRRLARIFLRVCEGVAYAHGRGVLHRDLKPQNVMIGGHGDVYVMDWGLAQFIEESPSPDGAMRGTINYLAPELLSGRGVASKASDIYALGAMLYEMLAGRPAFRGTAREIIQQVHHGPPPPVRSRLESPRALEQLALRAMARAPEQRVESARAFANEVEAWLDDVQRLDEARDLVAQSQKAEEQVHRLRHRALQHRRQAERLLRGVPPHAPESEKSAGWALEDEAEALERDAELKEVEAQQLLRGALMRVPDYQPAHARLASRYRRKHEDAVEQGDHHAAARFEVLLRNHDRAGEHGRYLDGRGRFTLHTDRPVEVDLYRYVTRNRRLVLDYCGALGRTPIVDCPLKRGSYVAVLRTEGATTRVPFVLRRLGRWTGGAIGDEPPVLPIVDNLRPNERYVPGGPFLSGGDERAYGAPLPRRDLWVDGFIAQATPVTNTAYIEFLDDLVRSGREADALRWAPREGGAVGQGALVYGRYADGTFFLQPDADGDLWEPEWPVVMVDHAGATAYAAWRATRDGLPWRLPYELEWEKAARGVDGRAFPWGDWMDPTWCNMRETTSGGSTLATVDRFDIDISPYRLRGMAGNVYDWCQDAFVAEGPAVDGLRWIPAAAPAHLRVVRGGSWDSAEGKCRVAYRSSARIDTRSPLLGFRLVRSIP